MTKAPAAKHEAHDLNDLARMARIREYKRFAGALEGVTNIASLVAAISEHTLLLREIDTKAKKTAAGAVEVKKPVAGAAKKAATKKAKPVAKKAAAKAKPKKKAAKKVEIADNISSAASA